MIQKPLLSFASVLVWAVAGALLGPAAGALAQQPGAPSFVVDRWTVDDGLPQNSVRSIAQTPDRYLWLGTRDGLARFDGFSFTVYNKSNTPAFQSNRVNALQVSPGGVLWVGTSEGLVRYQDGQFEAVGEGRDAFAGNVHSLAGGAPGPLWIIGGGGLTRYQDGQFETLRSEEHPGLRSGLVKQPYVDTEGRLWLLYGGGVATREEDGTFTVYTRRDGLPNTSQNELADIGEAGTEGIHVGTEDGRILRLREGRFETVRPAEANPRGEVREYLFGGPGALSWSASGDIRATREGRTLYRLNRDEARAHNVLAFYEDRAGNVWAGTGGGGLMRFRRRLFTVFDAEDGLSYDVTLSVTQASDGALWVGTNCAGLHRLENGRFRKYTGPNISSNACSYAVLASRRTGALWAGQHDLVRLDPDGSSTRIELPYDTTRHVYRGDAVKALYEDPDRRGTLWVGTIDGLYRVENGAVQRHYTPADGLLDYRVQYIQRARHTGALWLSTREGLSRFQDGAFENFTPENGFPSRNPRALYEGPDGALWIGTYGDGLVRYKDGTFTSIRKADGLFDDVVSAIVPDGRGNLWMSGNRGVFRARRAHLDAFADGERTRAPSVGYGTAAGLRNPETNGGFQPAAWKDRRERIWFPTLQGVAVVDPAEIRTRAAPPPARVEQVLHQNEPIALTGEERHLPKGRRSFEVAYTGISLSRPGAVRFRYKLDGFGDGTWQPAGERRQAFFTNVPPGDYTFRVQAARQEGAWSEAATARLVVPPYFYETNWFVALCVLLAVGLLAGGYAGRVYTLRRREERLQQRVDEQTEALSRAKETTERQARQLAELDEAKNRFFANITHEFRTPLTLILGPLKRLKDRAYGPMPQDAEQPLDLMIRNSRRLTRLIDQILDLTRLEAGVVRLDPERADLRALVERVCRRFAPLAERKRLTLTTDVGDAPVWVRYDPARMDHVLGNLLSNAIKFTPQGGRVRVQLSPEPLADATGEETRRTAALTVDDTGVGLSQEAQRHIFDRFFQVDDAEERRQEGAGIGLSLVRELVELHGGTVSVESVLGEGARFSVRLPLCESASSSETVLGEAAGVAPGVSGDSVARAVLPAPPAPALPDASTPNDAPASGAPAPSPEEDDRTTVLVVDDNADVRTYVRGLLSDAYRVFEAGDGASGLQAAREHLPDLILADVMMPEMDGLDMSRALKTDARTDCIPVLMLTARAGSNHAVSGLDAGAEDYIVKPFDADVLLAKVRATLDARRRLRRRLQQEHSRRSASGEDASDAPVGEEASTTSDASKPEASEFEEEVRAVMREHLTDPDVTVKQLAAEVALSRSHFSDKVKEETGSTPSELLRGMRMERAAKLLRDGAGSVSEVAYAVGFNSLSYFSRRFKAYYGTTPSAFQSERAASE